MAFGNGYNLVHDVFRCLWPGVYSGLQTTGLESQSSIGWIHTSVAKQMVAATAKQLGFQEKQKHKWWSWFLGIFPASNSLENSLLSVLVGHRSLFGIVQTNRTLHLCSSVLSNLIGITFLTSRNLTVQVWHSLKQQATQKPQQTLISEAGLKDGVGNGLGQVSVTSPPATWKIHGVTGVNQSTGGASAHGKTSTSNRGFHPPPGAGQPTHGFRISRDTSGAELPLRVGQLMLEIYLPIKPSTIRIIR